MPSALSQNKSPPCISCTERMDGIYSYAIRKECDTCGGHSLLSVPKSKPDPKKNVKKMRKDIAAK